MVGSILKVLSGIVAIVEFVLARVQEERLKQQGRDEVKAANTEQQLNDLKKANEIDKTVGAMSDDDLDRVLLGARRTPAGALPCVANGPGRSRWSTGSL